MAKRTQLQAAPRLLLLLALGVSGCTSYRSTVMQHLPGDYLDVNSVGHKCTGNNCKVCKTTVKGVPVKIKVPTHLEVTITETYYIVDGKSCEFVGKEDQFNVETNLAYTDKIMTVDFKRPAGGTLNVTGTTFDSEQYFKKLSAAYEEQTLKQINTAISSLKGPLSGRVSKGGSAGKGVSAKVHPEKRTVAFRRFDIREPGWEHQMHHFVDSYLGPPRK